MKRAALILFTPPVAVCKFGCAGCCAAPIAVFWLTGIVSMIYGFIGGPGNLLGPSWNTVALGLVLWGIASGWATITVRSADQDTCERSGNPICNTIIDPPPADESDPFDEVRKAR